jgi:hypothetical protein
VQVHVLSVVILYQSDTENVNSMMARARRKSQLLTL